MVAHRRERARSRGPGIRPRIDPPVKHVDQKVQRSFSVSLPLYPGAKSVELTKRIYNWKQEEAKIEQLHKHEQNIEASFDHVVNDTIAQVIQLELGLGTRSVFDRVSIQAENTALAEAIDPIARGDPAYDRVILADHGYQHGLAHHRDQEWVNCNDGRIERRPANWLNRSFYIKAQTDIHNARRHCTNNDKMRRGLQKIENPHIEAFLAEKNREASAGFFGERDRQMQLRNSEIAAYLLLTSGLGILI